MEILAERMNFIESTCSSRFRLDGGLNLSAFYSPEEDNIQIDKIFSRFSFSSCIASWRLKNTQTTAFMPDHPLKIIFRYMRL